jgi:hypothetical protein
MMNRGPALLATHNRTPMKKMEMAAPHPSALVDERVVLCEEELEGSQKRPQALVNRLPGRSTPKALQLRKLRDGSNERSEG